MQLFVALILVLAELVASGAFSITFSEKLLRRFASGAIGVSLSISTLELQSPFVLTPAIAVANALEYDENGEWVKPVEKSWNEASAKKNYS